MIDLRSDTVTTPTEAMRRASAPARAMRSRTLPMPISLPPSPTPTVVMRRGVPRKSASIGAFHGRTVSPRALR